MAELGNARRISYKATYNQISAASTVSQGVEDQPFRAVEKTAFVQALRIAPEEIPVIRKELSAHERGAGREGGEARAALEAIASLVGDDTATSTLRNAERFARIDPAVLVSIAQALARHRRSVAAEIDKSIASILAAHRDSLTRAAPAQASRRNSDSPGSDEGETHLGMTRAGIPIRSILAESAQPAAATRESARPAARRTSARAAPRETQALRATIAVDDSRASGAFAAAQLGGDSMAVRTPTNAEALAWCERYNPKLFADLSGRLAPYTRISQDQRDSIGGAKAVLDTLTTSYVSVLDEHHLEGTISGFESRMAIEPVGNLHLERIEMYPTGVQRGELVHSVPLAPGETVNISHKEWSVSEREFQDIVNDYFEGYSEEGVAEKTDIAMSSDSQSQHTTALNIGASLSASYSSVTLSTTFGYNAASNDTQSKKDSRNHSIAITKKASSRTKKDHKVSFKVTSIAGSEDQSVRVIANQSETDAMRIDYFQLARKWKVDLLRYGLRMTYDIVIPNPGSGIVTMVDNLKALDELINTPFTFSLPLSAITYHSLATDPNQISNYDRLAAQYNASVTAPPEARKWVSVHKEPPEAGDYEDVRFDSIEFDIDSNYYIYQTVLQVNYSHNVGDNRSFLRTLSDEPISTGLANLVGMSGHLALDLVAQYVHAYAINITFICRPKVQVLLDWRLQAWNQIRQAAEEQYNKGIQNYKDERAILIQKISEFDALTLRRMEQEEVMKGVLRWLLGPQFYLVPFNISSLFGPDTSDPGVTDVLDPNRLSATEWLEVMEFGEFIKYLHNAIEWENVLYFTYPYFWDDNTLWDFKKFLYHPDSTHRTFLRSGAARVVLTIRPGFETSFTSLVESGAFSGLPGPHPYVGIAQEIQNFAKTNYPGFPPANPEQNARPLLYLEQRRVWREMQFLTQLIDACKTASGAYPPTGAGNGVPVAALAPYLNGPVVINGTNYNGVNDYNTQANAQQLILDPDTPQEALLPTYANVPANDVAWNNPYFYKCPGDTGDYDLISYGADGQPGGVDKDADLSVNSEASLIATWFEYTPHNGLDIGITMNQPNMVPPQPSAEIA